jgi:hypothetical protein
MKYQTTLIENQPYNPSGIQSKEMIRPVSTNSNRRTTPLPKDKFEDRELSP